MQSTVCDQPLLCVHALNTNMMMYERKAAVCFFPQRKRLPLSALFVLLIAPKQNRHEICLRLKHCLKHVRVGSLRPRLVQSWSGTVQASSSLSSSSCLLLSVPVGKAPSSSFISLFTDPGWTLCPCPPGKLCLHLRAWTPAGGPSGAAPSHCGAWVDVRVRRQRCSALCLTPRISASLLLNYLASLSVPAARGFYLDTQPSMGQRNFEYL